MTRRTRLLIALSLAVTTALPVAADDKDFLRPVGESVPPNLLIVFGNSQTLTQTISFTGTATSTWDGDGDSPASKMGSAKRVIQQFVADHSADYNIGLTSFSHDPNAGSVDIGQKHWVYEAMETDFPGDTFAEAPGTLSRWGPAGEGPCTTNVTPVCTDRSPANRRCQSAWLRITRASLPGSPSASEPGSTPAGETPAGASPSSSTTAGMPRNGSRPVRSS